MRHVCLLAALLAPLAARAQIITIKSPDVVSGNVQEIHIGHTACKNNKVISFTWDLGQNHPGAGETVAIVRARDSSTCDADPTTVKAPDERDVLSGQTQQTGATQAFASELILDQTDAGMVNGCDNLTTTSIAPWTTNYCVTIQGPFGGSPVPSAHLPVKFAMLPPTPPSDIRIKAGDQHLRVDWTPGNKSEDIAGYDVHVLPVLDGGVIAPIDPLKFSEHVNLQEFADVNKTDNGAPLQNDAGYQVQVIASDTYQNVSDVSVPVTGTPIPVDDFYDTYREKGGTALGGHGCSSTSPAPWIAGLILAAGLLLRRRSRKAGKGALLVLGVMFLAPAARADAHYPAPEPRRFLIAIKADRYDPKVDSESAFETLPPDQRPYFQIFRGRAPLRWQLEGDWEIAHPFGSIMIGATVGYWENFGKGLDHTTGLPSDDTTLLQVIPIGTVLTWRFDYLSDRWLRWPLIPYAQIGLQYALWTSRSGTGAVSNDEVRGGRGSGWTLGYSTALGLAFNLDAIDPQIAHEAYVDVGIQRTSIFAEYGWTRLDGFHAESGVMILTDRAWRFGMSVEF